MKRVLVIVVTYNGMRYLERCLCSLDLSTVRADVTVVDNASSDGSAQWVEEVYMAQSHPFKVTLERQTENLGFGAANNIGIRRALREGYDYVYLLNQDAWLLPDTLSVLLEADAEARRLSADASGQQSRAVPAPYGVLSPMQMCASRPFPDAAFLKWYRVSAPVDLSGIKETSFVMAAHWLVSRECLEAVGGFSPAFSHQGEDDNFLHRAAYHGFRAGIVTEAFAVHAREDRPDSLECRLRRKAVGARVHLSDPRRPCLLPLSGLECLRLMLLGLRYFRLSPWKEAFRLFRDYGHLARLRRISREKGAFL